MTSLLLSFNKGGFNDFASYVFQKLKSTERYRLMLVDDLQVQLEEFVPVVKV
jgi:hypothetical protein